MKNKYVILVPENQCGGLIVLQTLYKHLTNMGEDVKIFTTNRFNATGKFRYIMPLYQFYHQVKLRINKSKKDNTKNKIIPFVGKNTIVIYPEVVSGNPLHAKKVVRWLLYHNKNYFQDDNGNPIGYDKNDLFFAYRDVFNDPVLNPDCKLLCTPYIDLDLYKRTNYGERSGKCYIVRKGSGRSDLPKDFDGIVIDNLSEKEKVEVFNKCEYCISYDTQTTYSGIAAICGCISVVVPEEGKTREDYLATGEKGYGRAYGFSQKEIDFAKDTQDKILEQYKVLNKDSIKSAKNFIKECENYFIQ